MLAALTFVLALPQVPPALPTQSTDDIKLTVLAETRTLRAARVTYARGAVEPPGPYGYDHVIVPIDVGISIEIEGKPVDWTPGVTILIPRGAPHRIWNASASSVTFVSVRILNEADPLPADESRAPGSTTRIATTQVTLVRNAADKYVRVSTFRFERGGVMRADGGDTLDAMMVLAAPARITREIAGAVAEGLTPAGTVFVVRAGVPFSLRNAGEPPLELVRISVTAAR